MVSSVLATVISRRFLGDVPAFIIPKYQLVSLFEIPLYVILGFIAAGVAVLFTKTLYKLEDKFEQAKIPEYVKPVSGGLLLGSLGLEFPYLYGVGYEAIDMALIGQLSIGLLFVLGFLKIVATSLTIGSGGSGGFFGKLANVVFPTLTGPSGGYKSGGHGSDCGRHHARPSHSDPHPF